MTTEERAKAFKKEWRTEINRRRAGDAALAGIPDVADLLPLLDAVAAKEREACARLADDETRTCTSAHGKDAARRIAEAIRARGKRK